VTVKINWGSGAPRRTKRWHVCDEMHEPPCIYDDSTVHRLRSDPLRCVRHGALLFYQKAYDGQTREQIRQRMRDDDRR
jgi:hypothetical protein